MTNERRERQIAGLKILQTWLSGLLHSHHDEIMETGGCYPLEPIMCAALELEVIYEVVVAKRRNLERGEDE
jgi:hypothetical protein